MKTKKISKKKAREMLYKYIMVHGMPITDSVVESKLRIFYSGDMFYDVITFKSLLKIAYES